MSDKRISILVPMYNEAQGIDVFFTKITKVLESLSVDWEIVCVDDGSSDNTLDLLEAKSKEIDGVKVVAFSRNFGKEAAMTAALDYATGDAVIPIDADLQDPPEIVKEMIEKWEAGADVVCAKRTSRKTDSVMKRQTAHWFYSIFNRISDTHIIEDVGDYRLMDRRVVEVIKQLPEKDRFMKGLFSWPGFKVELVEFERAARAYGDTKFNYWKLWNFALSGITSFTTMPIRVGTYVGLIISGLSFLYGLVIISKTMVFGVDVPGYASILVAILFLGGVQLFFLGLLGEYIGRIFKEVKNRPIYVVDRTTGFDEAP